VLLDAIHVVYAIFIAIAALGVILSLLMPKPTPVQTEERQG
jgi:hypothetical protein